MVRGQSSVTKTQEGGVTRSELDVVDGEIYEDGVLVSRFKSDKAFANDKDKSIRFDGHVSITSEKQKATLTADTVAWNDPEKLYDARGDVQIKSSTYEARAERLLADATLKRIATPDLFKK